jgi:hypothetical protein
MLLSLVPGIGVALFRDHWEQAPPAIRIATYVMSGILIVAACGLIVAAGDRSSSPPKDG